ncbi:EamA-like transporter family protein [Devosia equisanguinis]|uniref:EamA-like transporter family protein n=1 Tax=Devosia equisanguinis TaxID=2490941 RepID=A0A447ICM6_9HYPH|nr:DMT family transporter [Devosia equisanguinis]VDS05231.1 EamA-like transporter family protein [Devosia equisanguinis]
MSTNFTPPTERRLFGIGLALLAYFMFTGIDSSAKWLGMVGVSFIQIVFLRYFIHLLMVAAIHLPRHGTALVRTGSIRLQGLRALALLGSTACNFLAVQYLPLTVTGSIAFTVPLLICALSVPMLGEKVGWRRWTAIGVGFLGVLVIVRPGTDAFHPAALLSLLGALSTAFYMLFTRRVSGFDSAATSQFYVGIFATICLLPIVPFFWSWPSTADGWFAFFAVGVFGFVGHQLITMASGLAPATVLAPFAYFQIFFMAAASWFIFHQPPDVWLYVGAPIVIASGLYIWLRERKLAKPVVSIANEA